MHAQFQQFSLGLPAAATLTPLDNRLHDIGVESVNAGVVVLEGGGESLSAHRRAIEIAAHIPGVSRVESAT